VSYNTGEVYIDAGPVVCAWCKKWADKPHRLMSEHGKDLVVCRKCFRSGVRKGTIVPRAKVDCLAKPAKGRNGK